MFEDVAPPKLKSVGKEVYDDPLAKKKVDDPDAIYNKILYNKDGHRKIKGDIRHKIW